MDNIASVVRRYAAVLIFLAAWEACSRLGLLNPLFIPPFSRVVAAAFKLIGTGELPVHVFTSLSRSLAGFAAALVISVPLGVLLAGWSPRLRIALEPLAEWFSHINPFILFHIIILFLGIGEAAKIAIIAWTCMWPITFSTLSGIIHADPYMIKAARSFGLKRTALAFKVMLPAAASSIFAGMRLSAGYSLLFLVAAEMMGASSGLGWMVVSGQDSYQTVKVFAAVTVIALLAVIIDSAIQLLEKQLVHTEKECHLWQKN